MTKLYQHGVLTDLATVLDHEDDGLDNVRGLIDVNRNWVQDMALENEALALKLKVEFSN